MGRDEEVFPVAATLLTFVDGVTHVGHVAPNGVTFRTMCARVSDLGATARSVDHGRPLITGDELVCTRCVRNAVARINEVN